MRRSKAAKLAVLFSLFTFFTACSTAVTFTSNRPQEVKVNGMRVGTTPTTVSLSDAVWEDYNVVYTDLETGEETHFQATKEVKVGAVIGGIFLWPIFLWCYGPRAQQNVQVKGDSYAAPAARNNQAVDPEYEEYLRQKAEAEAAAKAAEEEAAQREYEEFQAYKKAKAEAEAKKKKK
ncbi:MAG: hypothetical protein IKY83_11180 [Proteobacteria bacterium]|nr:hypothetical protein [Pseudomonadota bacterium]